MADPFVQHVPAAKQLIHASPLGRAINRFYYSFRSTCKRYAKAIDGSNDRRPTAEASRPDARDDIRCICGQLTARPTVCANRLYAALISVHEDGGP